MTDPRRRLPGVDRLLASPEVADLLDLYPRDRVVTELRREIDEERARVTVAPAPEAPDFPEMAERFARDIGARLSRLRQPSLRPVVNATGVILHTNLGRAPLAPEAVEAMVRLTAGYSNLEFSLEEGTRGSRYDHARELLSDLTGAEDALVVNNAAGALVLALAALAGERGVVVSRGELIEIGGGFRLPEVIAAAGVPMLEVGTTNRTRIEDYAEGTLGHGTGAPAEQGHTEQRHSAQVPATQEATPAQRHPAGGGALLKVHRSNFRMVGFTEEAALTDLVALGEESGLPVVYDLGSGLMVDPVLLGLPPEPTVRESVATGADLVLFSGDKLLGGPQAGIVVGRAPAVALLRRHPLCRALRVDGATLAALEATLGLHLDPAQAMARIPVLRMIAERASEVEGRAQSVVRGLPSGGEWQVEVVRMEGRIGGGTFPEHPVPSAGIRFQGGDVEHLARALRGGTPPVVGRVAKDALLLDLRTVLPDELPLLEKALQAALVGA